MEIWIIKFRYSKQWRAPPPHIRPSRRRWFFDTFYNARVLPLVGWAVTGDRDAYRYLPDSIERFLTRAEFEDALRVAGFADVSGTDLFPAAVASLVVAR